jgi:hypothetical protein
MDAIHGPAPLAILFDLDPRHGIRVLLCPRGGRDYTPNRGTLQALPEALKGLFR